jgi:hypothetical protein
MGGGASGRGGRAVAHLARGGGALFVGEEEKKARERNGERLTLSSVVENEVSDFFSSLQTSESKHYRMEFLS